jgi:hypothetical protein
VNCPRCSNPVENGAAFCGNCGQALLTQQPPAGPQLVPGTPNPPAAPNAPQQFVPAPNLAVPGPQTQTAVPSYAVATPAQQAQDTKSLLSVIFGVLGLPFSIIPFIGLIMGVAGLVLGTLSRRSLKKTMSTIGIILSVLAIIASLGMWAYNISKQKSATDRNSSSAENSEATATSILNTPCYSITFARTMNTDTNKNDDCDIRAYESDSMDTSNDVYKVYGNQVGSIDESNFYGAAKTALEKDVSATLPGFSIKAQNAGRFAGSPAYFVYATDGKVAIAEAAVYKKVSAGYNVFSLVHAIPGTSTDLKTLEAQWQWK